MARKPGIVRLLAEKYNMTTSDVKRAVMKAATGAYKKILQELGLTKGNAMVYRTVLKHSLPIAWRIAREEQKLPTPEDVYKIMVAEWPNYKEELLALLGKPAAMATA